MVLLLAEQKRAARVAGPFEDITGRVMLLLPAEPKCPALVAWLPSNHHNFPQIIIGTWIVLLSPARF